MVRLLICDDEPGLRAVIKRYAQFEGYEVTEAGNGAEAVGLCSDEVFDIIIMDVMMPEMDGFTAVKEIRKFSDTPIIMISAYGEESDINRGYESGADDYIINPFSIKEIMLRINNILRQPITNAAIKQEKMAVI
jgi:DNA-binding response OmpR family regulator